MDPSRRGVTARAVCRMSGPEVAKAREAAVELYSPAEDNP